MKGLLVLASVLGVCVCLPEPITPTLRLHARRQVEPRLGDLIQEFALDLSDPLWEEPQNVAFSPLSIGSLLSVLMMGSLGTTYHQLRELLHYPNNVVDLTIHKNHKSLTQLLSQPRDGVVINLATRLFLQSGASVLLNFTQQAQDYYGASVGTLQFRNDSVGSMNLINNWVKQETRGKIPKLLTRPFKPSTIFVATNTVYFNGAWENPFHSINTRDALFNTGTSNITIPMMRVIMTVPYANLRELNAEMIALPYKGGEFAMFVIVPKGPIEEKTLQDVEFNLSAATINRYIGDMVNSTISVSLPRMRLDYKAYLGDTLKKLYVTAMFESASADFSKITAADHIWVEDMVHQTVVEITETGTEAAGATSISLNRIGTSNSFVVDRPSIFFIRHMETGLPLFWGRIMSPEPLYPSRR